MDLTVDHIIDVARKGNRIDPPYQRDAIKILFTKEPGDMDAQALKQLLAVYSEEFGVRLKIIGGGPGCTYFVIDGKPSNNLLDLLTSDEFIRGISKLGAKIIWSDEPGVRLPIDRFMDESIQSRADFAILTPLIEEFKPLKEALKAASCRGEIRIQNPNSTMTYYQYDLQSFSGTIHRVVATFMQTYYGTELVARSPLDTSPHWGPAPQGDPIPGAPADQRRVTSYGINNFLDVSTVPWGPGFATPFRGHTMDSVVQPTATVHFLIMAFEGEYAGADHPHVESWLNHPSPSFKAQQQAQINAVRGEAGSDGAVSNWGFLDGHAEAKDFGGLITDLTYNNFDPAIAR